jgi:hypothetical protein
LRTRRNGAGEQEGAHMAELVIEFPAVQRVLFGVVFAPIVLISLGFAIGMSPLVSLGIFSPMSGVLVYMMVRIMRIRWVAREDGLVFEGYLWSWFFPREEMQGVFMSSRTNMVRVRDSTGAGRSIPLGTAIRTSRSLAKGRAISEHLSQLWALPQTETNAWGLEDLVPTLQTPKSESRRAVRAPGAWAAAVAAVGIGLVAQIAHMVG